MKFPNFVGSFYTDISPYFDAEEAINFYLESNESGNAENPYSMLRCPGLTEAFELGSNVKVRGQLFINGHIFAVVGDIVYDFEWSGTALTTTATYGPISDDGKKAYFVADPARVQLVVYSGNRAYVIESGSLTEITWMGVEVSGIAFLNRYYLFLSIEGDGFFYSEPGDANTGDPLNFRSAEASANKFVQILVDHEKVWLMGAGSTSQVFFSSNDPTEPFLPDPSAVIPWGTAASDTPISFNGRVFWIDQNGIARRSAGYTPERISTHAVENQWRDYGDISDAVSWTAIWNGHNMIRFWFPSADITWEYDTDMPPGIGWHKVLSWDDVTNEYVAHRGMSSCMGLGLIFVGDRENGKIYTMSPDVYMDDGIRAPALRRAPVINEEGLIIEFPWFELSMQTGIGDGSNGDIDLGPITPEFDPVAMIRYSNDWGQNWSNELIRSLGQQGDFNNRVYVARCGQGRRRVFEVRISAGVPICINNAYLDNPESLG